MTTSDSETRIKRFSALLYQAPPPCESENQGSVIPSPSLLILGEIDKQPAFDAQGNSDAWLRQIAEAEVHLKPPPSLRGLTLMSKVSLSQIGCGGRMGQVLRL